MPDPIEPDDYFAIADILPDAPAVSPTLPPALEKLGPSPFPKSGFPFLGFLATVYDHISSHVPKCQRIEAPTAEATPSTDPIA